MSTQAPESAKKIKKTQDRDCAVELATLLQAVAAYEYQVEASRLALNVLPFYTPNLAYQLLTEFCPGGLLSHSDFQEFLDDWKVEYTQTTLKGLLMDFSPIRNIMDYHEFLMMTSPSSTIDKRENDLNLGTISEELRFKLESSLVLFILKELKYQDEVEKRRLKLFSAFSYDMFQLFSLIDYDAKGLLTFEDTKRFVKSSGLEFDHQHWDSLVFRAKKSRYIHPKQESISFMEFHDLIFPVTYFMIQAQKDISNWLNYLDGVEREADPTTPDESGMINHPQFAKGTSDIQSTPAQQKAPSNIPTETKQSKHGGQTVGRDHTALDDHMTEKKQRTRQMKSKIDLSFFDSLYRVTEDETRAELPVSHKQNQTKVGKPPGPPPPTWRIVSGNNTQRGARSARNGFDESFFEAGMDEPWLPFNKEYQGFYKGRGVVSKYTRYMVSFLEAANIMYG